MDKKIEQLIERYHEKRQIIELKQRHKIEELSLEAKINLKEAFLDSEDQQEFQDFDQFFKQLHEELIVKQEEFNQKNQEVLVQEKQKLMAYFEKIIGSDDQELLGTSIIENVMEQTMGDLESTVLVNKTAEPKSEEVVSENEPMTKEEIAEITADNSAIVDEIQEAEKANEMVSTIDLEDLLTEIKSTIDE